MKQIKRVEIINHTGINSSIDFGRNVLINKTNHKIEYDIQDNGQTLKIFISE